MRQGIFNIMLISCLIASGNAEASVYQLENARLKNAGVEYDDSSRIKRFPVPVVSWQRPGLAKGEQEINDIKENIVYPLVLESKTPVSAVIIEFYPNDSRYIGVHVIWSDGNARDSLINKTKDGRYDPKSYKVFFAKPVP